MEREKKEKKAAIKAKQAAKKAREAEIKKKREEEKKALRDAQVSCKPSTKPKKQIPTKDKNGKEFITLSEFGFNRENYYFIPTIRSFIKIKDHFLEQKIIGLDAEYHFGKVSTITLASEKIVAVFDMVSLKKVKEVKEYLKNILLSEKIEKVTHTFKLDAYFLSEYFKIDPYKIAKILDLTDIIKKSGSENKIGIKQMVESYFDKTLNQYYKKSKWYNRPIDQALIDYAALNGLIVLKIFLKYEKDNSKKGQIYFSYEPPKKIPDYTKKIKDEKKKLLQKIRKKGGNKPAKKNLKNAKKPKQKKSSNGAKLIIEPILDSSDEVMEFLESMSLASKPGDLEKATEIFKDAEAMDDFYDLYKFDTT